MARTRNHSVLSVRSPVEVSARDWLTATRMVAMAVPFWVVPTVGSAPRLPTSVKFNILVRSFLRVGHPSGGRGRSRCGWLSLRRVRTDTGHAREQPMHAWPHTRDHDLMPKRRGRVWPPE